MVNHSKKICRFSVRIPEHELEALKRAARAKGLTASDVVRQWYKTQLESDVVKLAERAANATYDARPSALPRYHVDMLGADPLRLDNGATPS